MKDLVALANFRTKFEAETIGGLLEDAGIIFLIQSLEGAGIVPGPRGATIMVSSDDLARAQEVAAPSEGDSQA